MREQDNIKNEGKNCMKNNQTTENEKETPKKKITTKDRVVIVLAVVMVILGFSTHWISTHDKKSPTTTPMESTQSSLPSVSAQVGDEVSAKDTTPTQEQDIYKTIEHDVKEFVKTYNAITNGGYEDAKQKYAKTKELMTETGANILVEPTEENKTNYVISENTITYKYKNITTYVEANAITENNSSVTVLLDCTQAIIRNGSEINSYPFMFKARFKYNEAKAKWLCDEINRNDAYKTNLTDENTEPQGD